MKQIWLWNKNHKGMYKTQKAWSILTDYVWCRHVQWSLSTKWIEGSQPARIERQLSDKNHFPITRSYYCHLHWKESPGHPSLFRSTGTSSIEAEADFNYAALNVQFIIASGPIELWSHRFRWEILLFRMTTIRTRIVVVVVCIEPSLPLLSVRWQPLIQMATFHFFFSLIGFD